MDNQRPELDLKFYKDICPDQNVFTKHDQFLRNVGMHLSDFPDEYLDSNVSEVAEKQFQEHYLHPLGDDIIFVQLEKMHMQKSRCDDLIEKTAAALNQDIIALMLFAVQKDNVQLSVKAALNRALPHTGSDVKLIVRKCLYPFPYIWFFGEDLGGLLESGSGLSEDEDDGDSGEESSGSLEHLTMQIMSLPSIQTLAVTSLRHHHLILAVILILKHATLLTGLSAQSAQSALIRADVNYQGANIDLKVQQLLTASSQEHSVELLAGFIMATDIETKEEMHVHRKKDHWFKRVFAHKPISLPKLRNNK
jgi:hypothetical protein